MKSTVQTEAHEPSNPRDEQLEFQRLAGMPPNPEQAAAMVGKPADDKMPSKVVPLKRHQHRDTTDYSKD